MQAISTEMVRDLPLFDAVPRGPEEARVAQPPATEGVGSAGRGGAGLIGRAQLIEMILSRNPSVSAEWLGDFDEAQLHAYAKHLQWAEAPRGRGSVWVRLGETRAVVTRESRG